MKNNEGIKSWVEHVKKYSNDKKIKYNEAMKSQECKDLYHKNKPTEGNVDKVIIKPKKTANERKSKTKMQAENMI